MAETESVPALHIGSPPAPSDLYLLEGFLNTWSGELAIDDFSSAKATEAWLRSAGLWAGSRKLTSKQHQKIVKFRHGLRTWILDEKTSKPLNDLVKEVTFQAEFDLDGDVHIRPAGSPYEGLLGALTKLIADSQENGTWSRFKCCELSTCGWAYYDSTRSRTRRWCSMKTCGSRHKARKYYERNR